MPQTVFWLMTFRVVVLGAKGSGLLRWRPEWGQTSVPVAGEWTWPGPNHCVTTEWPFNR